MLDWERLRSFANDDGEFRLHARFWNATIRLGVGDDSLKVRIDDGAIAEIGPWFGVLAGNLAITAPEDDWQALLAAKPRPFYQDLYPATIHHGFDVAGDIRNYCAYYPAIRRLIEIMREVNNEAA